MASHRTLRTLLTLGVVFAVLGLVAAYVGSLPTTVSETDYLPPGWVYFTEFPKAVVAGGTIQGSWQTENGTPLQVLVYNDADYGAYVTLENRTALYNVTATSGTLSLSVPGFDTYHVVVQHPVGYEDTNLTFTIQLTQTGSDPTFTLGGIVGLVVGGIFLVYSVLGLRKPEAPPGILPSRGTVQAPSGTYTPPNTPTSDSGNYRVPPPLPGSPDDAQAPMPPTRAPAAPPSAASDASAPVGTLLVTVQNATGSDATVDLVVNGVAVTSMTVGAGQAQQVSVSARLSSPFGSTVTVEAVMANGHRARQAVFVGARGTAPVTLRIV